MSSKIVIPIAELVERTSSRNRGKEAFENLLKKLSSLAEKPLDVVLDLSNVGSITASFLDELVLRSSDLPSGVEMTFRLRSREDLLKLEKICAIRQAHCRYQIGESNPVLRTERKFVPTINAQEFPGAFFTT